MRIDDDGVVVFKAEVGAVAQGVCQVQGVWVDPAYRGSGCRTGMAAVVDLARAEIAPTVSCTSTPTTPPLARRTEPSGSASDGTFATVLF